MRCVIIGAGPAGLGAAGELERLGADWLLFEAESGPGGLCRSFQSEGFTWDMGGHVIFSHYAHFDRMLDSVADKSEWLIHERRAFVRVLDRWIPYPFQCNIGRLPDREREECLAGLEAAAAIRDDSPPRDLQEWIRRSAGDGIARLFLDPYNRKVWGAPPSALSAGWLGERIAVPDAARIRKNIQDGKDDTAWGPNRTFRFPVRGGTGEIWRRVADRLPRERLHFGCALTGVDMSRRTLRFNNGRSETYDALITTIPLDKFARMAEPEGLGRKAAELCRSTARVVGIGIRGAPPEAARDKTWMYFPEPVFPFYRATVFSNYSPFNAPGGCYSLMAEVTESVSGGGRPQTEESLQVIDCPAGHEARVGGEPPLADCNRTRANRPSGDGLLHVSAPRTAASERVVSNCLAGLRACGLIAGIAETVHTWSAGIEYCYPLPTPDRDGILEAILPVLERNGILSRGRFGAWKYEVGNMDHSFAQGVEAAGRIVNGAPEITVNDPGKINHGG